MKQVIWKEIESDSLDILDEHIRIREETVERLEGIVGESQNRLDAAERRKQMLDEMEETPEIRVLALQMVEITRRFRDVHNRALRDAKINADEAVKERDDCIEFLEAIWRATPG